MMHMKAVKLWVIAISFLAVASCDKIEAPYGEPVSTNPVDTGTVVQKVLLEDFTGFHCTNCPDAHRKAAQLKALYGERLLVLGLHVGIFAQPNIWGPLYTYDFRNQIASDVYAAFANNAPLPIGMVNRLDYQGSTALYHGSWSGAVAAALAVTPKAGITFTDINYDINNRTISGSVDIKFLSAISNELSVCFYTVEDSIIQPQLDNGTDIPQYTHLHVLRGSLNSTWGESIGAGHTQGSVKTVTFSGTFTPADALPEKSYIYAILIDKNSRQVIQVEEEHVID
jgi:hypothetical protein